MNSPGLSGFAGQLDSLRILLVEDDRQTLDALVEMLHELGIRRVSTAGNGLEALKFLDEHYGFDGFIISDWNMPKKTGIELLREIRQSYPKLPFLMITARADENSVVTALKADVTGYIRKPFTLDELEHKISGLFLQDKRF